jgi:hypothetical protein
VLLHKAAYPLFAHAVAACNQFFPHLGPTVFLFDLCMDGPNVDQQGFITDALVRPWLAGLVRILAPPVLKVAAGADAQYVAGQRDGPASFVAGNPGVLHIDSRAKYAVAFFKISRSIFTRASSALNRASSICSGLTGLSPAPLSWPLALSLTQFSKVTQAAPDDLRDTGATYGMTKAECKAADTALNRSAAGPAGGGKMPISHAPEANVER